MESRGLLAFDIAAQIEVGDGNHQMRAGVVMAGNVRTGIQIGFGYAHAVLDEHNVLRAAAHKNVEAAFFVPGWGRIFARGFVLQELDGHVAEGRVGEIAHEVSEVAGSEPGFAVLQFERDWWLALDVILDLRWAEGDVDVIVVVGVEERGIMRGDLDLEDADVLIFEHLVMMRLGGDFEGCGLCDEGEGD